MPKPAVRGFKLSMAENEFMLKHVQSLLDKGLQMVQPSLGPFASPILVVKKPQSSELRCVIDYRKMNQVTAVGDEYVPATSSNGNV